MLKCIHVVPKKNRTFRVRVGQTRPPYVLRQASHWHTVLEHPLTGDVLFEHHRRVIPKFTFFVCCLTHNIPSLALQRCLPSCGPRRTPWSFFFFVISQLFDAVDYSNCVFLGFWNYNSVIQALLASNILCLFISTEVTGGTELLHTHSSLMQHLNNVIFWALSAGHFSNLQRSEPKNNKNNNIPHL